MCETTPKTICKSMFNEFPSITEKVVVPMKNVKSFKKPTIRSILYHTTLQTELSVICNNV